MKLYQLEFPKICDYCFNAYRKVITFSSKCNLSTSHLTPERSVDDSSRLNAGTKLEGFPAEPLTSFAIVSANVKYPGLHGQGTSSQMTQVSTFLLSKSFF